MASLNADLEFDLDINRYFLPTMYVASTWLKNQKVLIKCIPHTCCIQQRTDLDQWPFDQKSIGSVLYLSVISVAIIKNKTTMVLFTWCQQHLNLFNICDLDLVINRDLSHTIYYPFSKHKTKKLRSTFYKELKTFYIQSLSMTLTYDLC